MEKTPYNRRNFLKSAAVGSMAATGTTGLDSSEAI